MYKTILSIFTLLSIIACSSQAKLTQSTNIDEASAMLSAEEIALIDSLFQDFSGNRPGATVMIAKGEQLLFCKGYGLVDIADPDSQTDCNTKYHLGSASKQFTVMAILQLIEAGKLTFNTTLQEIFPKFPDYGQQVTIQHLLTHRSGLAEITSIPTSPKLMTDQDRLQQLLTLDTLAYPPGAQCEYSNTGYSVLAEIVSQVSGLPFDEYMEQAIFSPIGMSNTDYYPNSKDQHVGYHILEDTIVQAKGIADATMGSGSVYTSAKDYFQWHLALTKERLVAPTLHQQAYQAQEGTKNRWGHYGYGWYAMSNDTFDYVEHGGVTQSGGFICFTARIPQQDITVAIFTNRAWSRANQASQHIGTRAKALLSIATDGAFPMPPLEDIGP